MHVCVHALARGDASVYVSGSLSVSLCWCMPGDRHGCGVRGGVIVLSESTYTYTYI